MQTRREWLAGMAVPLTLGAARPEGVLVDTHIHLFDPSKFPYHLKATYQPPAQPLAPYLEFIKASRINHVIIVHPEPYQDDHAYLEHCFAREPVPGFFKGTCLFDPVDPKTPTRVEALTKKHPGRIVALRIHENRDPKAAPTTSGAIRDRDMRSPQMKVTWAKVHSLGLAIQMHFIPGFAPQIGSLAGQFREMPVILDHLARAGQGAPAEYDGVLELAKLPRTVMKFSGVGYSSKQPFPHRDVKPLIRRTFDAFGPGRMIWGGLGMNMAEFEKAVTLFEECFDFASEADKARIRGENALRLYRWQ